jgi:hypothetical protein
MIVKIDKEENAREISNLKIERLKSDVVPILNVQRGIDIYISFITDEKYSALKNVRVLHFTGPHASIWSKERAQSEVLSFIINGGVILSNIKYPDTEL